MELVHQRVKEGLILQSAVSFNFTYKNNAAAVWTMQRGK